MSQDVGQTELRTQTEQLLNGPLKHARAAGLAAALLPLASVAVSTASAQSALCASAGVSGVVWQDTNNNGVQDQGEPPIPNAVVTSPEWTLPIGTDEFGVYQSWFGPDTVAVQIPPGTQPSPANVGDDAIDSDGVPDGFGNSVAASV